MVGLKRIAVPPGTGRTWAISRSIGLPGCFVFTRIGWEKGSVAMSWGKCAIVGVRERMGNSSGRSGGLSGAGNDREGRINFRVDSILDQIHQSISAERQVRFRIAPANGRVNGSR